MLRMRKRLAGVVLGLAAVVLLGSTTGCATNPATGKTQLALITEQQEIAMGKEADQQISAQMGLYDDPDLQQYVQELGQELAAESERPHLPWTFRVLDDPVVNAFALPGGFVYVTRGIMAHMASEAELVTVLGHEIGHVTARHSVSQMSKAQLANLGLGIGMMVKPELGRVADLMQAGVQLMFLKFSRDDESQADGLGVRYSVRSGYDPREMPEMFTVLQRVSEAAGGGRVPGWASTHPAPANRRERINEKLASMDLDYSTLKVEREGYSRRLDGMIFGANPREGYFEDNVFLHPDMKFRLEFPEGWTPRNQRQAVGAMSPDQDAMVVLTLAAEEDPPTAARTFLSQEGVRGSQVRSGRVHGLAAAWGGFEADAQNVQLGGKVVCVRHSNATFQLLGYTLREKWGRYQSVMDASLGSMRTLSDPKVLNVQPARLKTIIPDRDMSLEEFNRRYPSTVSLETLALVNHIRADELLRKGVPARRVIGGIPD